MADLGTIGTARLRLEPLVAEHAAALFEGLQHGAIYEFIDDEKPLTREALSQRYRRLAMRRSPDGKELWLNWAVWSLQASCYVGYVQATVQPDKNKAYIAYVLFPPRWNRGYGFEAVEGMISYLRQQYEIQELVARVDHRNRRSIALLCKLGFAGVKANTRVDATGEPATDKIFRLTW